MCGTDMRQDLILTPIAEASCGCCSTPAATTTATTATSASSPGTEFALEGLTCGHCVQTVTTAIQALADVDSAAITLVPGGTSTLTVSGHAAPEDIRAAVKATGYAVTGS